MIHDILQTDIELATRLRTEQRPDEEIIQALVYRGVDRSSAAGLVDDLRNGRARTSQSPLPPEFAHGRRSRSKKVPDGTGQSSPAVSSPAESRHGRRARRVAQNRKKAAAIWLATTILVGLAITVVVLVVSRRHHDQANSSGVQTPKAASAKTNGPPR
jgi:hypothetical protein